jgi:ring-1,2-phenylacetyl-CoA epoxidase subunit PaaB
MNENLDTQGKLWEVFIQSKPGLPHKHAGSVHAMDKEMALQNARDLYTRRSEGTCIWVVPNEAIVSSNPEDMGSFFDPADDKIYRHPTHYVMPKGAKHI